MKVIVFDFPWPRIVTRMGLLLLLVVMAGCGPGEGKVSGRVLFNGKPLPGGTVFFQPAGPQNPVTATLPADESGTFEVVLPTGEVQVSVDNRDLEPRPPAPTGIPRGLPGGVTQKLLQGKPLEAAQPPADSTPRPPRRASGKYVKIPDRYYSIATSGLKITVQRGSQTKDIELTK